MRKRLSLIMAVHSHPHNHYMPGILKDSTGHAEQYVR